MTLTPTRYTGCLPAIYRIRDATAGEPLRALFGVIAEQVGVLEQDLARSLRRRVHRNRGTLGGSLYRRPDRLDTAAARRSGTAGGRAEVANTIGYRQRKGTVIALEQLGADVTGRPVRIVEYFRRLAVNQSLRHLRPDAGGYADLRNGAALARLGGPFDTASRTVDVRRIAPRDRPPARAGHSRPRYRAARAGAFQHPGCRCLGMALDRLSGD